MKKYFAIFIATLFSIVYSSWILAENQYAIIVDAGSTGSRLHLFQYETEGHSLPVIKDVFTDKTKIGLATFAKNPEQAGESLKPLFDKAYDYVLNTLQADPAKVHVSVMGTAGMRLIKKYEEILIYINVYEYLNEHYPFQVGSVETISGKKEGIYDWIDVNYLLGNFDKKNTIGTIDMGGASTQIAFETTDYSKMDDEVDLYLAGKHYTVFSKSFLGLGQDEARKTLIAKIGEEKAKSCFPTGAPFTSTTKGDFNFTNCSEHFAQVIRDYDVKEQLIPFTDQPFAAFSGAFYTYDFFGVDKTPQRNIINKGIQDLCGLGWEGMKKERPKVDEKYIMTYCANGAYFDKLFFDTYQLKDDQLTVVGKIDGKEIDWTVGALLYRLTQKNIE